MTQTLDGFGSTAVQLRRRRRRRRRRRLIVSVVGCVVLLVFATAAALAFRTRDADSRRVYLSTDGWPERGQGAYQLGGGQPAASPHEDPVPIASLAKVMTALVVLQRLPLDGTSEGPTLVVRDQDVADTARRADRDESVVAVRAGERLTERQALMALLLPSANNVAAMLARYVSGSVDAFVGEMNVTAESLGMTRTTYTDPSGFDPATVSTAVDQLTLARHVADNNTLTAMMSTSSYRLPVAGTVANTNTLLGQDGFVGMKTGSDDAAGGCFMFRSYRSVHGLNTELIGVVLGQRGHNLINAGLYAARQLADRIAPTPAVPRAVPERVDPPDRGAALDPGRSHPVPGHAGDRRRLRDQPGPAPGLAATRNLRIEQAAASARCRRRCRRGVRPGQRGDGPQQPRSARRPDRLIAAVARASPRTVVVLTSSSAVTMPWLGAVGAVIEAWYPGQTSGTALAQVLFGDTNPSGKLPGTFPRSDSQGPARSTVEYPGDGDDVYYAEGLRVGYRWYDATGQRPLFPFGYGLSYTSFRFSHLTVARSGDKLVARLTVTNTGRQAAAEVAQLYVGSPAAAQEPPRQLKAYTKVSLAPGRSRRVTLTLDLSSLASWDNSDTGWVLHNGTYRIYVGDSSRSLPLTADVRIG